MNTNSPRKTIFIVLMLLLLVWFIWYIAPLVQPFIAHVQAHGLLKAAFLYNYSAPGRQINDPHGILTPAGWTLIILLIPLIVVVGSMRVLPTKAHGSADKARRRDTHRYHAPLVLPQLPGLKALTALLPGQEKPGQYLLLGRYQGQSIGLSQKQQQENAVLTAPIGAGKTTLVILRNLLRETGLRSLFIADVKAELVRKAAGYLSEHYTVLVFAPGNAKLSNGYNPLKHVKRIADAQNLADCWIKNTGISRNDDFWMKATRRLFIAAVLHLRATEPDAPFSRLADILASTPYDEMKQILTTSLYGEARKEAIAAFSAMDKNERMAGGILADMGTRFDLMMDPDVKAATSYNDIDFAAMAVKPIALFLSIPPRDMERSQVLMATFIMQMFSEWSARAEKERTGQLPMAIECYLDEFANLGYIYGLTGHLTTMRHIGVGLLIVLQAFTQLDERYSLPIRKTVLTNCTTHLLLPGAGQDECEYYSARIGDTTVSTTTINTTGSGLLAARNYTQGETRRRLYTPDELRRMSEGTMLVLGASVQPMMVKATPWFKDSKTRDRADLPFAFMAQRPIPVPPPSSSQVPKTPPPNPAINPMNIVDADDPTSGLSPE